MINKTRQTIKKETKVYEDYQPASLYTLYVKCKGKPSKKIQKKTATMLNMEEKEVCCSVYLRTALFSIP